MSDVNMVGATRVQLLYSYYCMCINIDRIYPNGRYVVIAG